MTQSSVVFITGASAGIGAALAQVYAEKGCHLVLTARRVDRLESVAKVCKALNPQCQVLVMEADVTHRNSLDRAVQKAKETFGGIDTVIANAGFGVVGPIEKLTVEDYRRQFETNVFGMLHTIYATLGELKKTKGRLALMGSVAGYFSEAGRSPYAMSKFSVRALAEALRFELMPAGISVTLISPGFVESEIRKVDNLGRVNPVTKDRAPRWLIMNTLKAARQMVKAIERRKRERIITTHGKIMVLIQRHLPWALYPFIRYRLRHAR